MAEEKIKKPTPTPKDDYGKPPSGHFRVIKMTYKGRGAERKGISVSTDVKNTDVKLSDLTPDKEKKDKTLLEVYKAKAKDPKSKVVKVIE